MSALRALRLHTGPDHSNYLCGACKDTFDTEESWRNHAQELHFDGLVPIFHEIQTALIDPRKPPSSSGQGPIMNPSRLEITCTYDYLDRHNRKCNICDAAMPHGQWKNHVKREHQNSFKSPATWGLISTTLIRQSDGNFHCIYPNCRQRPNRFAAIITGHMRKHHSIAPEAKFQPDIIEKLKEQLSDAAGV